MRGDRACRCGHRHDAHEHYSSAMLWCSQCDCPFFWWRWLSPPRRYPCRHVSLPGEDGGQPGAAAFAA